MLIYLVMAEVLFLLLLGLLLHAVVTQQRRLKRALAELDGQLYRRAELILQLAAAVPTVLPEATPLLAELARLQPPSPEVRAPIKETLRSPDAPSPEEELRTRCRLDGELAVRLGSALRQADGGGAGQNAENLLLFRRAFAESEEPFAAVRRRVDAAVAGYNECLAAFPTRLVAGWLGYRRREPFSGLPGEHAVPNLRRPFQS